MKTKPIEIPDELIDDRAVKRLITAWVHAHARYHVCTRRVNWKNERATIIEKKRRREKWQCVARILEIERTLIRWAAKYTHHPEIWMSKKEGADFSVLKTLEGAYYLNRQRTHGAIGKKRVKGLKERTQIISSIRAIHRKWMLAYIDAVDPSLRIPKPLPLHPRELLPRKLARASKELLSEVA